MLNNISTSINFDIEGKQHGFLSIPHSSELTAWSSIRIPVCVIRRGEGPTVSLIGGVHGDEYEGPVTIMRLSREIPIEDVTGCLILAPCLNAPAVTQGSRWSPDDHQDMNQAFPGRDDGSITQRIAALVSREIIKQSDYVLDLRAGGGSLQFTPLAAVTQLAATSATADDEKARERQAEDCMIAFGAPNSMRMPCQAGHGTLDSEVKAQGKVFITTELGGGGTATAETLDIARTGCLNVLSHIGLLERPLSLRATRMLELPHDACVTAPAPGLVEMRARLGNDVYRGDVLALIVDPTSTGGEPVAVRVPRNGVLTARHHRGLISAGDCLALIADEVQR